METTPAWNRLSPGWAPWKRPLVAHFLAPSDPFHHQKTVSCEVGVWFRKGRIDSCFRAVSLEVTGGQAENRDRRLTAWKGTALINGEKDAGARNNMPTAG